jgi:hypothetical protein
MRRIKRAASNLAQRLKSWTPSAIQLVGMASFSVGWFLIAVPVGLILTGLLVMAVGWALDGER